MAQIALFHSVLGMRPGITAAAERFRSAGHEVLVVDQYDGRTFDDYVVAADWVQREGGYPPLLASALAGVAELDDGFVAAGFSNGAGMAEYVALHRPVAGVLMFSGAIPVTELGGTEWPAGVPAQIHYMTGDRFRQPDWGRSVAQSVHGAGGYCDVFDYEGDGHLFTDDSLPDEYAADAADLLFSRALTFVAAADTA